MLSCGVYGHTLESKLWLLKNTQIFMPIIYFCQKFILVDKFWVSSVLRYLYASSWLRCVADASLGSHVPQVDHPVGITNHQLVLVRVEDCGVDWCSWK